MVGTPVMNPYQMMGLQLSHDHDRELFGQWMYPETIPTKSSISSNNPLTLVKTMANDWSMVKRE